MLARQVSRRHAVALYVGEKTWHTGSLELAMLDGQCTSSAST